MKKWILITLLSVLSSPAFANSLDLSGVGVLKHRGVRVGGSADFDACGSYGVTTAATVMYATDSSGLWKLIDVPANTHVFFCDKQGEYTGVVIDDNRGDCKVSSPIAERIEYNGPCLSGWIKHSFLDLLAG